MDVFEAIDKRHSYRGAYLDQPVPREDLRRIVQAGVQAPSGCNAQTTTFVIVDDPQLMSELKQLVGISSPAAIACIADPVPVFGGMTFEVEDCSAAVENMLLAITALGYATVWLDGVLRGGLGQGVGELLGVPDGKRVQVILPVGVPVEVRTQREKKPLEDRAWFNRWGE